MAPTEIIDGFDHTVNIRTKNRYYHLETGYGSRRTAPVTELLFELFYLQIRHEDNQPTIAVNSTSIARDIVVHHARQRKSV